MRAVSRLPAQAQPRTTRARQCAAAARRGGVPRPPCAPGQNPPARRQQCEALQRSGGKTLAPARLDQSGGRNAWLSCAGSVRGPGLLWRPPDPAAETWRAPPARRSCGAVCLPAQPGVAAPGLAWRRPRPYAGSPDLAKGFCDAHARFSGAACESTENLLARSGWPGPRAHSPCGAAARTRRARTARSTRPLR